MLNIDNLLIELPEIDFEDHSILRISIDTAWVAEDFALLFENLAILYQTKFLTYKAVREANKFVTNPNNRNVNFMEFAHTPLAHALQTIKWQLASLDSEFSISRFYGAAFNIRSMERLRVQKIQYASPGFTDLLGVAAIMKEIKEALMYYFPNKIDKESYEIQKQKRVELQIKNLKTIGFSDIEIRASLLREDRKIDGISNLIDQALITDVSELQD